MSFVPAPQVILLLPMMRMFLAVAAEPENHVWRTAYDEAAITFGEARGLMLAHKCQKMLWALMRVRPVPIEVAEEAFATKLTDDEVLILEMLTAMRGDDMQRARDVLSRLTHGCVDAEAIRLGLELAGRIGAQPPRRQERPRLRVV
ncbi:MAG: hypothetical protein AAGA70_11410 [Pseudomonadota bacterium]